MSWQATGGRRRRATRDVQLNDVHTGARLGRRRSRPSWRSQTQRPPTLKSRGSPLRRWRMRCSMPNTPAFLPGRHRQDGLGLRPSRQFYLAQARHGRGGSRLPGSSGAKRAVQPQCVECPRHCPQWAEDLWLGPSARAGERGKARPSRGPGVAGRLARPRSCAPGQQCSLYCHPGLLGHMSGGPRSCRGGKSRRGQSLRPDCVGARRRVCRVYRSLGRRRRAGGKGPQAGGAHRRSRLVVADSETRLAEGRVSGGVRRVSARVYSSRSGCRTSISPTRCHSSAASMKPSSRSRRF